MSNPIRIENDKLILDRPLTKDDFNVVREKANSICFILDLAEEFWEYVDYPKEVRAFYKVRLKQSPEIKEALFDKKKDYNILSMNNLLTILKVHKLEINKPCTDKTRDAVKDQIELQEKDAEANFYKEIIGAVTKAINKFNQ